MDRRLAAVALVKVAKEFGGNVVLRDVDFDLFDGEVHALAGANGSGKSTLMKIVYGAHRPSRGVVRVRGRPVRLRSPGHAIRLGIAAVPQELPLVPPLSVAENICFGELPRRRGGVVSWRRVRERAAEALALVDREGRIPLDAPVGSLDLSSQQVVAVARALARGASILVFDEPTSALDARAQARLYEVVHRLRSEGRAVAFISQRLDDIFAVADRISVLRDGETVASFRRADASPGEVARLMTGHAPVRGVRRAAPGEGRPLLEVRGLGVRGGRGELSFSLRAGEILGIAGLAGSGAEDVPGMLFGRWRASCGRVLVEGKDLTHAPVRRRVREGLAYVSGDRQRAGLVLSQTVAFNLGIVCHCRPRLVPVSSRRERARAVGLVAALGVRPADPDALAGTLSGGNQQKVVVGRWLAAGARIWLLDDPTRGVDVHARSDIHALLRSEVARGAAAIVTSSDVEELLELCDRLLVVTRGRVVAELDPTRTTEHEVLALAGGVELLERAGGLR